MPKAIDRSPNFTPSDTENPRAAIARSGGNTTPPAITTVATASAVPASGNAGPRFNTGDGQPQTIIIPPSAPPPARPQIFIDRDEAEKRGCSLAEIQTERQAIELFKSQPIFAKLQGDEERLRRQQAEIETKRAAMIDTATEWRGLLTRRDDLQTELKTGTDNIAWARESLAGSELGLQGAIGSPNPTPGQFIETGKMISSLREFLKASEVWQADIHQRIEAHETVIRDFAREHNLKTEAA